MKAKHGPETIQEAEEEAELIRQHLALARLLELFPPQSTDYIRYWYWMEASANKY